MSNMSCSPPKAPPIQYNAPNGTRWQKEKAAAGSGNAFEFPDDPKLIGPWIIGECIGKGASGRVKIAKHRRTGQLAAVKILPLQPLINSRASLATQMAKSEKQRLGIDREITMMKLMDHPNIMRIYDVFEGEKELYLVLEYVEGGELFDFLVNRGRLPPLEALAYFKQLVYGLAYAHAFSIIHRDLKPENILIHSLNPPLIKIADWGMAAFAPPALQLETSCGSPHYASPEIVNGDKYEGNATDIWSCGVILYALLTGRLPFDDKNVRTLLTKVKLGKYEVPHYIEPQAKDLISRMIEVDVNRRITIPEILAHPWLQTLTPGIRYVAPPPVADLARPLPSFAHIDSDLLESLCVIWGRYADVDGIIAELLSPAGQGVFAKAFYFLLYQYRERTLQEHGIVDDENLSENDRIITKQYLSPVSRKSAFGSGSQHLEVDPMRTPRPHAVASPHQPLQLPAMTPPGLTPLSPAVMRPSSPGQTPRMRPVSPVGPRPIRVRPLSTPTSPYPPAHPAAPLDIGVVRGQQGRQGVDGGNRARAMTADAQSPSYRRAGGGDGSHSPERRSRNTPAYMSSDFIMAMPSVTQGTANTARNLPLAQDDAPASPMTVDSLPLLTAPRVADREFQRTIDTIADRVNDMIARGQLDMALFPAATPVQAHEGAQGYFHANLPAFGVGENKENGGEQRGESGPTPTVSGLGLSRAQYRSGVMGREMGNIIYMGSNAPIAADGKGKKEKKHRPPALDFHARGLNSKRSTFSVLGSPTPLSPTTTSSILTSPVVGEFKGWFSNLFHWKTQSHVFYSLESVPATRTEAARLLESLGISVLVEDTEGWGTLRCHADDRIDVGLSSGSGSGQKHARFRVEFSLLPGTGRPLSLGGLGAAPRASASPFSSSHFGGGGSSFVFGAHRSSVHTATGLAGNVHVSGATCAVVILQEKGSVSIFKAVCRRLRQHWKLDMPRTEVDGMPILQGQFMV